MFNIIVKSDQDYEWSAIHRAVRNAMAGYSRVRSQNNLYVAIQLIQNLYLKTSILSDTQQSVLYHVPYDLFKAARFSPANAFGYEEIIDNNPEYFATIINICTASCGSNEPTYSVEFLNFLFYKELVYLVLSCFEQILADSTKQYLNDIIDVANTALAAVRTLNQRRAYYYDLGTEQIARVIELMQHAPAGYRRDKYLARLNSLLGIDFANDVSRKYSVNILKNQLECLISNSQQHPEDFKAEYLKPILATFYAKMMLFDRGLLNSGGVLNQVIDKFITVYNNNMPKHFRLDFHAKTVTDEIHDEISRIIDNDGNGELRRERANIMQAELKKVTVAMLFCYKLTNEPAHKPNLPREVVKRLCNCMG